MDLITIEKLAILSGFKYVFNKKISKSEVLIKLLTIYLRYNFCRDRSFVILIFKIWQTILFETIVKNGLKDNFIWQMQTILCPKLSMPIMIKLVLQLLEIIKK